MHSVWLKSKPDKIWLKTTFEVGYINSSLASPGLINNGKFFYMMMMNIVVYTLYNNTIV